MVKIALASPKDYQMANKLMGMGKYSLKYHTHAHTHTQTHTHTHKISRFHARKMMIKDTVELSERMFYGAKLLSHKET